MDASFRPQFNAQFSIERYQAFLKDLEAGLDTQIAFRVAETPLFFNADQRKTFVEAGEQVLQQLLRSDLKALTETAIPSAWRVPGDEGHTLFLALDFALCEDAHGNFLPQLIELQGFPSLFAYESVLQEYYRRHYNIPEQYSVFLHAPDVQTYQERFRKLILNGHAPESVILLEVEPEKQGTAVDFVATERITGVRAVCISKLIREGTALYYMRDGEKTRIRRIYNRVIVDEFMQRTDLECQFHLTEPVDVEWAGHPNWFYRISKYIMPLLKNRYVPDCQYLSALSEIPQDLENYVLKPLFSFAGSGVIFHVKPDDIAAIPAQDRGNYLLQRKVQYAECIPATDGGKVKAEVRLLYFWEEGNERPELVINLARLSRGEMIGVKFNKDKTWVGGSVAFFEH